MCVAVLLLGPWRPLWSADAQARCNVYVWAAVVCWVSFGMSAFRLGVGHRFRQATCLSASLAKEVAEADAHVFV
jgi:hypothetical protein